MASPSASVMRPPPDCLAPDDCVDCGKMKMMLAPSVANLPVIRSRVPVPRATTITTAATPMRMPSTVSAARSFERAMARKARKMALR
jgi:hypothetical protein